MAPICLFILSFFMPLGAFGSEGSEAVVTLPPVEFTGKASFETLNQNSFIPSSFSQYSSDRNTALQGFKWETPYSLQDYGTLSGPSGVNVGGRSIEDTQVTTLGVPLNYPQGGGADFSALPSFLWDHAVVTPTTSSAGFAPGAASGHVEFIPWTRARLLDRKNQNELSRATGSYDVDSQSFSLGTRHDRFALLAGASTGRLDGISGSMSVMVHQNESHQMLAHLIGTDTKAESPGSLHYPTPQTKLRTARIIPVVESDFRFDKNLEVQSTVFADLSKFEYQNPNQVSAPTRTTQYGLENALIFGSDTLAFSTRFIQFRGSLFGDLHEWPAYLGVTHEFLLPKFSSLKVTADGTALAGTGIHPGGRLSLRSGESEKTYAFYEFNTIAKMPSLIDRFGVYPANPNFPTYHGNPNLSPERVYALLLGFRLDDGELMNTETVKFEYRKNILISTADYNSMMNAGDAYLISLNNEFQKTIFKGFSFHSNTLLTYSRLRSSTFGYPDVPLISEVAGVQSKLSELILLATHARLIGISTASGGGVHPAYALFDAETNLSFSNTIHLKLGIDNLFDSLAQAKLDYPLPGRRFFASFSAEL